MYTKNIFKNRERYTRVWYLQATAGENGYNEENYVQNMNLIFRNTITFPRPVQVYHWSLYRWTTIFDFCVRNHEIFCGIKWVWNPLTFNTLSPNKELKLNVHMVHMDVAYTSKYCNHIRETFFFLVQIMIIWLGGWERGRIWIWTKLSIGCGEYVKMRHNAPMTSLI